MIEEIERMMEEGEKLKGIERVVKETADKGEARLSRLGTEIMEGVEVANRAVAD